jgi:hypothetical protein
MYIFLCVVANVNRVLDNQFHILSKILFYVLLCFLSLTLTTDINRIFGLRGMTHVALRSSGACHCPLFKVRERLPACKGRGTYRPKNQ